MGEWMYSFSLSHTHTHTHLISAQDWGELSTSCASHLSPRGTASSAHWLGSWVGPRASLHAVERTKISSSPRNQTDALVVESVAWSLLTETYKTSYCTWPWASSIYFPSSQLISIKSTLMLSFYLLFVFQVTIFQKISPPTFYTYFLFPLHPCYKFSPS
jgi:hypothetical protein